MDIWNPLRGKLLFYDSKEGIEEIRDDVTFREACFCRFFPSYGCLGTVVCMSVGKWMIGFGEGRWGESPFIGRPIRDCLLGYL